MIKWSQQNISLLDATLILCFLLRSSKYITFTCSIMYRTRFYFLQLFLQFVSPNFWPFCITIRNKCLLLYIHSKQLWATLVHLQIWLPSTVRRSQRLGCCKGPLCQLQYAGWRQWHVSFYFLSRWEQPNCQLTVIKRFLGRYGIPWLFTGIIIHHCHYYYHWFRDSCLFTMIFLWI